MEFHSFDIKDKDYINSFFGEHHYEQCDCSFNTLFLWQHAYNTVWAVEDNILFIRAGRGDMACRRLREKVLLLNMVLK